MRAPALAIALLALPVYAADDNGTYAEAQTWHDLGSTVAGDTFTIDPGVYSVTGKWTITKGVTVIGSGNGETGSDTILEDDRTSAGILIELDTVAGQNYRLSNFRMRNGTRTASASNVGAVKVKGESKSVRVDNIYFDEVIDIAFVTGGAAAGVFDSNRIDCIDGNRQGWRAWHDTWPDGSVDATYTNGSWTDDPDYGGTGAWYFEDNYLFGSPEHSSTMSVADSYAGARQVIRFNTFDRSHIGTHGTGDGSGEKRGPVWFEVYHNDFCYTESDNTCHIRGGTGFYFGNEHWGDVAKTDTDGPQTSLNLQYHRGWYSKSSTAPNFEYCDGEGMDGTGRDGWDLWSVEDDGTGFDNTAAGDGTFASGTISSGALRTMTVSPDPGWADDQWEGYTVVWTTTDTTRFPSGKIYGAITDNTSDTINIKSASIGNFKNYAIFESSQTFVFRRLIGAIDMPGMGSPTSAVTDDNSPFDIGQETAPWYTWDNLLNTTRAPAAGVPHTYDIHLMNEEASYDGTTGMGVGTAAEMALITPTLAKTAFWVTDEGEWWDANAGADGRLYQWNGSSWVLYYTPLTYPHPLRTGGLPDPPAATPSTAGATDTEALTVGP